MSNPELSDSTAPVSNSAAPVPTPAHTISANGLDFGYLAAGDPGAPLALCLHGFPDSANTWRHLLPELAAAGFYAVAPFQRGYAPTSIPADGVYQTGALAADANALHAALGADGRAVIIGHDWGAPAAYGAANSAPEKWSRVVGMSVPPGGALAGAFTGYRQLKKSWYMFFFQHGLADFVVGLNDLAFIDGLWADWSPGFVASSDLPHVKAALGDPANLAAALGYYRAALGDGAKDPALDEIQAAVGSAIQQRALYLHGADDGCIGGEIAPESASALQHRMSRIEVVPNAGHFLQLEQPTAVNRLIIDFLLSE
jgi:pimeloyl-ACP methyl ester carboxylesterase